MVRFVVIALIAVLIWALLLKLVKETRNASIDWTGVTVIVGFVVMAFWLRHVTGMG